MVQSQESKSLTIGKLAAEGKVGVETVRYYQRRGLLETPTRYDGIRRYGLQDLRRLHFIRQAQAAGFTLEAIQELLALDAGDNRERAREMARERVSILDEKIRDLTRARNALKRLAQECSATKTGPCPILKSFEEN